MFSIITLSLVFVLISTTNNVQKDWPVPAEYKTMKNPMAIVRTIFLKFMVSPRFIC